MAFPPRFVLNSWLQSKMGVSLIGIWDQRFIVYYIRTVFLSVIHPEHDTSISSMIKGSWTLSFHHCVNPTMTPPSHTQLLTSCGVWPVNQDLTLVHLLILDFHISFAVDTDKWHLITVMSRVHRQNKQKQKNHKKILLWCQGSFALLWCFHFVFGKRKKLQLCQV